MTAEDKPIKVPNFQTERKFSAWFTKLLRQEFGEHIVVINITGTAYGNNGVSDLIICFYGIFFAVELKMDGKQLTKLQLRFSMQIDRAGGRTLSPVTPSSALQALDYFRAIEQYRAGRQVIQSLTPEEAQEVIDEVNAQIEAEEDEGFVSIDEVEFSGEPEIGSVR